MGSSSASSGHFSARELNEEDIAEKVAEQYGVEGVKIHHDSPPSCMTGRDSINLELSLSKLFNCMSLAYGRDIRIAAPKFRPHKGLKITRRERARMNNIVWRDWHQQFIKKLKPSVCTFCADFENQHKRPTDVLMEGQYWKRRVEVVIAEYKKWRVFNKAKQSRHKLIGLSEEELLFHVADHGRRDFLLDLPLMQHSPESRGSADAEYMDMSNNIFTAIQTLGFPHHTRGNHTEINSLDHLDILQPSLIGLEQDLMFGELDTAQPLEDLLVEAVHFHMDNLNEYLPGHKRPRSRASETVVTPMLPNSLQNTRPPPPYTAIKRPRPISTPHSSQEQKLTIPPDLTPLTTSSGPDFQPLTRSGFQNTLAAHKQSIMLTNSAMASYMTQYTPSYSNTPTNMQDNPHNHTLMATSMSNGHPNLPRTTSSAPNIISYPNLPRTTSSTPNISYPNNVTKISSGFNFAGLDEEWTPSANVLQLGAQQANHSHPANTSLPLNPARSYGIPSSQLAEAGFNVPETKVLRRHRSEPSASQFLSQEPFNQSLSNFPVKLGSPVHQLDTSPYHLDGPARRADSPPHCGVSSSLHTNHSPPSNEVLLMGEPRSLYTPSLSAFPPVTFQLNSSLSPSSEFTSGSSGAYPPLHSSPRGLSSPTSLTSPTSVSQDFIAPSATGTTSEQKRRQAIKQSFETLTHILPNLHNSANNKTSNAAILTKAAEYITECFPEQKTRRDEMEMLEREVEALTTAIRISQGQLPATGLPGRRDRNEIMKEMYKNHVRAETLRNWKFYLFGKFMNPLFDTFCDSVKFDSVDELYRSSQGWLDQRCNLPLLRSNALQSMREVSVETSILSEPARVPEQARTYVQKP